MPGTTRPRRLRVSPKKEPSQARSRQMVRRILDAALVVLTRDGVERFTINHVAAEGRISVASVYQFFPNKQAIIYRLYQDWLAEVTARLDAAIEEGREDDWRALASRLAGTLSSYAADPDAEHELVRAMWSHRELHALDREHSRALSSRVATEMRRLGSTWPRARLERLALFANELFTLVAERSGLGGGEDRALLSEFARLAYVQLWAAAFEPQVAARGGRRRRGVQRASTGS